MKKLCAVCWIVALFLLAAPALAKSKKKSSAVTTTSTSASDSLYSRLGGEKAVKAVVDEFVTRASSNPRVDFFRNGRFAKTDVSKLKRQFVEFIGSATGGPQKYTGRDLSSAHDGMKITEAEFDALVADLSASLDAQNVAGREKAELLQIAKATKFAIVSQ